MRLICPNCGAQYEVDAKVIPEAGRDVQCSNCGHTWFQKPPHMDAGLAAEMGHELRAGADQGSFAPRAEPSEPPARPEDPVRRRLDPKVASLLREEAAREAAARRGETGRIESQPDLGLEDASRPRRPLREPEPDPGPPAPPPPPLRDPRPPRREMLPDVEEINSTLRASDAPERAEQAAPGLGAPHSAAERGRRRARAGFWLMILLAVAAALGYGFAPQIVARVPGAEAVLTDYVNGVNALRDTLDGAVSTGLERINEMIGGGNGG